MAEGTEGSPPVPEAAASSKPAESAPSSTAPASTNPPTEQQQSQRQQQPSRAEQPAAPSARPSSASGATPAPASPANKSASPVTTVGTPSQPGPSHSPVHLQRRIYPFAVDRPAGSSSPNVNPTTSQQPSPANPASPAIYGRNTSTNPSVRPPSASDHHQRSSSTQSSAFSKEKETATATATAPTSTAASPATSTAAQNNRSRSSSSSNVHSTNNPAPAVNPIAAGFFGGAASSGTNSTGLTANRAQPGGRSPIGSVQSRTGSNAPLISSLMSRTGGGPTQPAAPSTPANATASTAQRGPSATPGATQTTTPAGFPNLGGASASAASRPGQVTSRTSSSMPFTNLPSNSPALMAMQHSREVSASQQSQQPAGSTGSASPTGTGDAKSSTPGGSATHTQQRPVSQQPRMATMSQILNILGGPNGPGSGANSAAGASVSPTGTGAGASSAASSTTAPARDPRTPNPVTERLLSRSPVTAGAPTPNASAAGTRPTSAGTGAPVEASRTSGGGATFGNSGVNSAASTNINPPSWRSLLDRHGAATAAAARERELLAQRQQQQVSSNLSSGRGRSLFELWPNKYAKPQQHNLGGGQSASASTSSQSPPTRPAGSPVPASASGTPNANVSNFNLGASRPGQQPQAQARPASSSGETAEARARRLSASAANKSPPIAFGSVYGLGIEARAAAAAAAAAAENKTSAGSAQSTDGAAARSATASTATPGGNAGPESGASSASNLQRSPVAANRHPYAMTFGERLQLQREQQAREREAAQKAQQAKAAAESTAGKGEAGSSAGPSATNIDKQATAAREHDWRSATGHQPRQPSFGGSVANSGNNSILARLAAGSPPLTAQALRDRQAAYEAQARGQSSYTSAAAGQSASPPPPASPQRQANAGQRPSPFGFNFGRTIPPPTTDSTTSRTAGAAAASQHQSPHQQTHPVTQSPRTQHGHSASNASASTQSPSLPASASASTGHMRQGSFHQQQGPAQSQVQSQAQGSSSAASTPTHARTPSQGLPGAANTVSRTHSHPQASLLANRKPFPAARPAGQHPPSQPPQPQTPVNLPTSSTTSYSGALQKKTEPTHPIQQQVQAHSAAAAEQKQPGFENGMNWRRDDPSSAGHKRKRSDFPEGAIQPGQQHAAAGRSQPQQTQYQQQQSNTTQRAAPQPPPHVPRREGPLFTSEDVKGAALRPPLMAVRSDLVVRALHKISHQQAVANNAPPIPPFLGRVVYDPFIDPADLLDAELMRKGVGGKVEIWLDTEWLHGEVWEAGAPSHPASSHPPSPSMDEDKPLRKESMESSDGTSMSIDGKETQKAQDLPPDWTLWDLPPLKTRKIWGTDVYTDDSDILAACIHSGWLRLGSTAPLFGAPQGDTASKKKKRRKTLKHRSLKITIVIAPRLIRYEGSLRAGVRSRSWGNSHDGVSYAIESVELVENAVHRLSKTRLKSYEQQFLPLPLGKSRYIGNTGGEAVVEPLLGNRPIILGKALIKSN